MCQLRHDGCRLAFAGGGQALRLRGACKLLASRQAVAYPQSDTPGRSEPILPTLPYALIHRSAWKGYPRKFATPGNTLATVKIDHLADAPFSR